VTVCRSRGNFHRPDPARKRVVTRPSNSDTGPEVRRPAALSVEESPREVSDTASPSEPSSPESNEPSGASTSASTAVGFAGCIRSVRAGLALERRDPNAAEAPPIHRVFFVTRASAGARLPRAAGEAPQGGRRDRWHHAPPRRLRARSFFDRHRANDDGRSRGVTRVVLRLTRQPTAGPFVVSCEVTAQGPRSIVSDRGTGSW
jgi:hypothetical protein